MIDKDPGYLVILLNELNLSQQDLAELCDVQDRTARRWIAGRSSIPEDVWDALSDLKNDVLEVRDWIIDQCKSEIHVRFAVVIVFRTNTTLHRYGPNPKDKYDALFCAFAGVWRAGIIEAMSTLESEFTSVSLVAFDETDYLDFLDGRKHSQARIRDWAFEQVLEG